MKQGKVLVGAVLAVGLVVGLYFLNRYWIAPATKRATKRATNRPLAPEFSLPAINGRMVNLADYRGKVILLNFWATWCGPCQIEIPGFVKIQERYRGQGLVVIGISMDDSPEPVREFYQEFKMNYPVVMADQQVPELYGGIWGLPTSFLIGRDGRIYSKHAGAADVSVFEEEIKELLAVSSAAEAVGFKPVGAGQEVELGDPAEVNSEVPGVNLSRLSAEQVTAFENPLEG